MFIESEIIELLTIAIFFISFYGLITSRNIIKSIVFTVMKETAVIMFFLGIGYHSGILPPIGADLAPHMVADPLPQALMITAVVIGVCSTAINIVVFISLYRQYGTATWDTAKELNNKSATTYDIDKI